MKFWEAMRLLQEGRKVRAVDWEEDVYIANNLLPVTYWSISSRTIQKEWELYEEPEQLWSFAQVLDLIGLGGKFARKAWGKTDIYLTESKQTGRLFLANNSYHTLTKEDYLANDWYRVE